MTCWDALSHHDPHLHPLLLPPLLPSLYSLFLCSLVGILFGGGVVAVRLYEGHIRHLHQWPVAHTFEYPMRYALIDLDRRGAQSNLRRFPLPPLSAHHP
ncbi:hypothetical protein GUJ93_ZPchr0012g19953 [Zizania palustris]|uniref:Uncharacterized protein n=1 Tax=Zizania palustris TaxID=103762 RepID=A0A8J5WNH4_ZIZPA|nr:hypothetical protein GUJ93_ZPchr0012g19953 [Zizania palustris]